MLMSNWTEIGAKVFIGVIIAGIITLFVYFGIYISKAPNEGEIVSLNYGKAYTSYTSAKMGENTCTTIPIRHNETFSVTINDGDGGWTNTINVPEFIWRGLNVGDYFDKDCLCVKGR